MAQKGHSISFLSPPRNLQRLPKLPSQVAPLINLVSIPLPNVDNLPPNAESTRDLSSMLEMRPLMKAFDGLQETVTSFLETTHPDWIIHDIFPHWLPTTAAKLGISHAQFCITGALSQCSNYFTLCDVNNRNFKLEDFLAPSKCAVSPSKSAFLIFNGTKIINHSNFRLKSTFPDTQTFLIRGCLELEGEQFHHFESLCRKPVIPLGLIPPSIQVLGNYEDNAWEKMAEWLDQKEKGSVIYVAHGSEVTLSQEDLNELALGLELSNLPFFWVLKKPNVSVCGDPMELPDGFEERIRGKGVLWWSWAPQLKILANQSVGGFLSHSGWGSIIEALNFGLPFVMLPFAGDQLLNARLLESKNVGVEIPRNEHGRFRKESVSELVRLVMVEEKGKIYRDAAKEMGVMCGSKELHQNYIDNFVLFLEKQRSATKAIN